MSLLYIFLIFFSYTSVTLSDAIAKNGDKAETVGWQPDPNGRGTFTLVSSCVLTLIICVYSAMHLNVPPRHESIIQFWVRNIRWALLGIFGPELVVFIAWKQYLSAKSLVRRAQREPLVRKKSWLGGLFEKPIDLVKLAATPFSAPSCTKASPGIHRTPINLSRNSSLDSGSRILRWHGRFYLPD